MTQSQSALPDTGVVTSRRGSDTSRRKPSGCDESLRDASSRVSSQQRVQRCSSSVVCSFEATVEAVIAVEVVGGSGAVGGGRGGCHGRRRAAAAVGAVLAGYR